MKHNQQNVTDNTQKKCLDKSKYGLLDVQCTFEEYVREGTETRRMDLLSSLQLPD